MTIGLLPGAPRSVILQGDNSPSSRLSLTKGIGRAVSSPKPCKRPGESNPMRILIDQRSYDEMSSKPSHPRDCYVRGTEYLHHAYVDGVKYLVARAIYDCIKHAQEAEDGEALLHLMFHKEGLERMVA